MQPTLEGEHNEGGDDDDNGDDEDDVSDGCEAKEMISATNVEFCYFFAYF